MCNLTNIRGHLRRESKRLMENLLVHLLDILIVKRRQAGQHFEQQGANGPPIHLEPVAIRIQDIITIEKKELYFITIIEYNDTVYDTVYDLVLPWNKSILMLSFGFVPVYSAPTRPYLKCSLFYTFKFLCSAPLSYFLLLSQPSLNLIIHHDSPSLKLVL